MTLTSKEAGRTQNVPSAEDNTRHCVSQELDKLKSSRDWAGDARGGHTAATTRS